MRRRTRTPHTSTSTRTASMPRMRKRSTLISGHCFARTSTMDIRSWATFRCLLRTWLAHGRSGPTSRAQMSTGPRTHVSMRPPQAQAPALPATARPDHVRMCAHADTSSMYHRRSGLFVGRTWLTAMYHSRNTMSRCAARCARNFSCCCDEQAYGLLLSVCASVRSSAPMPAPIPVPFPNASRLSNTKRIGSARRLS